ncbi:CHAP domain-containing protein [Anaeromyxobacter sp. Fw109-5]|uniref:CHAP domain-containing protein n=1 Tax=Anaeromyxobacter sp. (strain Fw109-5) TaxID=404589 RepID=UPI0000ED778A|nr:CHAP domain-containing protein [Anaeromyxobacter sp. Fw109-5]ABS24641.1 conserved hypothetical protein [Anaeromyxobacter sp. Fw109-5]
MNDRHPGRTASRAAPLLGLALALATGCAAQRAASPATSPSAVSPPAPEAGARAGDEPPDAGAESTWGARDSAAPKDAEPAAVAEGDPELEAVRARVVDAARALVGRRFRGDCSAFVLRAFHEAGVRVRLGPGVSRSESLHRASRPLETPRPGALAFFHDSYDRDRDRRRDDRFTHVALVERVEGSSVILLHRARKGVERTRMDLSRPGDPDANGRLRVRRRGDPRGTRYLTGELFAAFGELLEGEFTQMLQAGRAVETDDRHPAPR